MTYCHNYYTCDEKNWTPTKWLSCFVITCMITDRIGLHSVLLPSQINSLVMLVHEFENFIFNSLSCSETSKNTVQFGTCVEPDFKKIDKFLVNNWLHHSLRISLAFLYEDLCITALGTNHLSPKICIKFRNSSFCTMTVVYRGRLWGKTSLFLNKNQTYKERKLNMHKKSCDCAETVHENQGKRFSYRFCIESHPVPDTS